MNFLLQLNQMIVKSMVENFTTEHLQENLEKSPSTCRPRDRQSVIERQNRDQLISDTDWTQASDIPQSTKDKWAIYRQLLRDVPQQEGFPFNIVWPEKPS